MPRQTTEDDKALEQAAKYICTTKCGLCPMMVEHFPCPGECTLDTVAWQCWISYFRTRIRQREQTDLLTADDRPTQVLAEE